MFSWWFNPVTVVTQHLNLQPEHTMRVELAARQIEQILQQLESDTGERVSSICLLRNDASALGDKRKTYLQYVYIGMEEPNDVRWVDNPLTKGL